MKQKREKQKFSFLSLAQAIFISADFTSQNDLDSHASACAFGFLFSFLPLVLMVFSILIRIMHASKEVLHEVIAALPFLEGIFNFDEILSSVNFSNSMTIVDIVLGVWIFWMARNLFLYIQKGITRIFHKEAAPRPVLNQLLVFGGELILVLGATALVLISISFKTLKFNSAFIALKNSFHPHLLNSISKTINIVPYVLIFILVFFSFRFYTGTKPSAKLCALASFFSTGIFIAIVIFLNVFLDFKRYNLIYGILGNLVILLFEVKIFFFLFFVFAQFVFVIQFFDDLLLAKLYLLPDHDETDLLNAVNRALFIRPDFLIGNFNSSKKFEAGETIVKKNSSDDNVYYIISGSVKCIAENNISFFDRGAMFGEAACLLNTAHKADFIASTECRILEISGATFRRLIDLNGDAAKKAVQKLSAIFNSERIIKFGSR